MVYQLSMLDKCPLHGGITAHQALLNAVETVQAAEVAGFTRFWVAEHHNSLTHASSAPEILVSYLLAATQSIRIGTGGVMLQHYSPYKIAEVFNVLASLAPGRVDIGIGKAPGGLPSSTQALQLEMSADTRLSFEDKALYLSQFLEGYALENSRIKRVTATPVPVQKVQGFLLGASIESAKLAAKLGWKMSYAGHLNGSEQKLYETFAAYKSVTKGDVPQAALAAIVAPSIEEANARAANIAIYKIHFSDGKVFSLPSYTIAEDFAAELGRTDYQIKKEPLQIISGTAKTVSQTLFELQHKYGIQEFMLEFPETTLNERITAIESLAYYQQKYAG
ncbi:MsnO8 family LLM class oxidoreductase [Ignatzschineria larvae DSM 13226]|uniref:MsnO8 family LLM class oxidoreductase n=1 Tax=Ignatzschineria larvae DSM 13226 TaxID=1111732 RepID=A0ABZ3C2S3_9GAMM|nr:MsnO8 family LLM class oxidoreductase [Ignatzschineria larvae]